VRLGLLALAAAGAIGCSSGPQLALEFQNLAAGADQVTVTLQSTQLAFTGMNHAQGSVSASYPGDGTLVIVAARDAFSDGTLRLGLSAPQALDLSAHAVATAAGAAAGAADAATHVTPGTDALLTFDFAAAPPPDLSVADFVIPQNDLAVPDMAPMPSLCNGSSPFVFCDGFELDSIDLSKWVVDTQNGGAVLLDYNRAYRGKHSLHVLVPSLNPLQKGWATLDETRSFDADGGINGSNYYVRAFVWLASTAPGEMEMMTVSQSGANVSQEIAVEADTTNVALLDGVPTKTLVVSTTQMPLGQWVCLGLLVTSSGVDVYLNDQPVPMLNLGQPTSATPPIGMLSIGLAEIRRAQNMPAPQEAWFDEVVVDNYVVTCDK
jgi:hypothetical protein